jgi:hypothetical protein
VFWPPVLGQRSDTRISYFETTIENKGQHGLPPPSPTNLLAAEFIHSYVTRS